MTYKALVLGLILLVLFGGILPLMLSPFVVEINSYEGYLSWAINFVQNGVTMSMPNIFGFSPTFTINPFSLAGDFQSFIINQLAGFQLIPAVIGVPLLLVTASLLAYGIIKLLPFG